MRMPTPWPRSTSSDRRGFAKCEMREIQPRRFDPWVKHPTAQKILLDPAGRAVRFGGIRAVV